MKPNIASIDNILELNKKEAALQKRVKNDLESLKDIPIRREQIKNTELNQLRMNI